MVSPKYYNVFIIKYECIIVKFACQKKRLLVNADVVVRLCHIII